MTDVLVVSATVGVLDGLWKTNKHTNSVSKTREAAKEIVFLRFNKPPE
jgi:hypothetical protein